MIAKLFHYIWVLGVILIILILIKPHAAGDIFNSIIHDFSSFGSSAHIHIPKPKIKP